MKTKRIKAEPEQLGQPRREQYYTLPADAASYEAMVEQMARAIHGNGWTFDVGEDHSRECYYDMARAALKAIGIVPPKKTKGTK